MAAIIIACFAFFLFFGFPIAYVMGLTGTLYVVLSDNLQLFSSIPSQMIAANQNFGFLAIPMFILVGELMSYGGITTRLVRFARNLVGHFRGGLAYVNVVANMFLASIMGSTNAQTAMMSRVIVPEMVKEGYKKEFSTALTVASALIGPIIPPSIVFILYALLAEVSVADMFLAGIIPGILLGVAFMVLIALISIKEDFPKHDRVPIKEVFKSMINVIPALLIPIIILVGILAGIFTATESAAIAALVAFIAGKFIYKDLKLKHLRDIFLNTAMNTSIVTFIVAMASMFSWILTLERIPHMVVEVMLSISENKAVFLLLFVALFFIIGMFLDTLSAMIVMLPILLPVAIAYGIDPIHFGVILCVNITLGIMTPPFGTALFIASSITKVKFEVLSRSVIPFIIVAVIVLLIITYVPAISMWIPNHFG